LTPKAVPRNHTPIIEERQKEKSNNALSENVRY
jgi:hypothetical protein